MIKIVLDTNMILSATIFGGMVEIIIDLIMVDKLQLFISNDLTHEVEKKLIYFQISKDIIAKVKTVMEKGILVNPTIKITVCRDPKDDFILELAETSQADYIITRDKDLLELPNQIWKSSKIMKPE